MENNEPYVIVNTSSIKRVQELYSIAGELLSELQSEVYSESETAEENRRLVEQMDLRCDEKNDLWKEIMRLQLILDKHGIDYGMEDEDDWTCDEIAECKNCNKLLPISHECNGQ